MKTRTLLLSAIISSVVTCFSYAESLNVDFHAIETIESHGNPHAYNRRSGAVGLYQITPVVLKEYNAVKKTRLTMRNLYRAETNRAVATWYLTERIPQMLRHFHKPLNVETLLTCYNAGVGYVVHGWALPKETKDYIVKYKKLTRRAI